jgi:hypothetical protein
MGSIGQRGTGCCRKRRFFNRRSLEDVVSFSFFVDLNCCSIKKSTLNIHDCEGLNLTLICINTSRNDETEFYAQDYNVKL